MIAFRCREHRVNDIQRLWQISEAADGTLAGRPIEGSYKDGGQKTGGWVLEARKLVPGLYCQHCLDAGGGTPLADYDEHDLRDAGLLDTVHVGLTAADFQIDSLWGGLSRTFKKMVAATSDRPAKAAVTDPSLLADNRLLPALKDVLRKLLHGQDLYSHQVLAVRSALDGRDVVIVTATASGTSLCYWIPILNALLTDSGATALYLAPLNALAEDQLDAVARFGASQPSQVRIGSLEQFARTIRVDSQSVFAARYDGSNKNNDLRRTIRERRPRLLITNPDMLHMGILPYHSKIWGHLFSNLRYIVLDELHVYKGMFGANFANVLRRVLRVAASYGKRPQIIACSASIGNPKELFEAITGRTGPIVIPSSVSGAPVGKQKRVVLDLAKSTDAMPTVAKDLMVQLVGEHRARTIAFMRSIPEVDQVYRYVSGELGRVIKGIGKHTIREYKREIPAKDKAQVTADLKKGSTLGVVTTTALQLGIDIGDLSACIVCKFPGSKAAFFQQAGRVGRTGESLVFFIGDDSPLDQHYVQRPSELLSGPAEVVYLNPNHRQTVLNHLRCAAEELPLDPASDAEFWGPQIKALIKTLSTMAGMKPDGREVLVIERPGKTASEVKIRSLGFECLVTDQEGDEVARPDVLRAMRRFHKYARFQIQDQSYEVTKLRINWATKEAEASARVLDRVDYTTASVIKTECAILKTHDTRGHTGEPQLERGEVRFTVHVDGYYRIPPSGRGDPEYQPLGKAAPPRYELDTDGLWFVLPPSAFAGINPSDHAASVYSAVEALRIAAALLCSTDPDDIGSHTDTETMPYRMFLADSSAGGDGLTEQVYGRPVELVDGAIRILRDCPYCRAHPASRGCPRCVTTPWGQDSSVCREGALSILGYLRKAVASKPGGA
jgi:DEAD/DEAH box helicase domain-containing protein